MNGVMLKAIKLAGTDLRLAVGQKVYLIDATNQPAREDGKKQYFASKNPHEESAGLLITADDVAILNREGEGGKKIVAFEIIDHGVEHEQYFQGCGVALTQFTDVATGTGVCADEALNDAFDILAQNGWDVDDNKELASPTLSFEADIPQIPDDDNPGEITPSPYYWHYVSVRVRGEVDESKVVTVDDVEPDARDFEESEA